LFFASSAVFAELESEVETQSQLVSKLCEALVSNFNFYFTVDFKLFGKSAIGG
jgi:hypothetical protein